jgi:hypothetical protein
MKRLRDSLDLRTPVKMASAASFLCASTVVTLPAQTLTTLFSFDRANGELPSAPLVEAADGNSYGTTYRGGSGESVGAVIKISQWWRPHDDLQLVPALPVHGRRTPEYGPHSIPRRKFLRDHGYHRFQNHSGRRVRGPPCLLQRSRVCRRRCSEQSYSGDERRFLRHNFPRRDPPPRYGL